MALPISIAGAVLLVLAIKPAVASQSCDTSIYPLSAPTARFIDHHDGTVTDTQSGMGWMRCAIGQSWTGNDCAGSPTPLSWQAAQDQAAALDGHGGFAGHADWRMPHIPELATIAERQCRDPRINTAVFPGTPAAAFWTSSTRAGPHSADQGYYLDFGPDGTGGAPKDSLHFVRLMRKDAQK